jgi:hygromycin-B 4-O-kinase
MLLSVVFAYARGTPVETDISSFSTNATFKGVSADRAAAFLANRFGDPVPVIEPLRQGAWSNAYGFHHAGGDFVIRFSAYADDFARDRIAAGYATRDLPIPKVTEVGETMGGYYAISERASGGFLDDLDGHQMRVMLPSLFSTLDAMRAVDLSGTSGFGNWGEDEAGEHASWQETMLAVALDTPDNRGYGWRKRLENSPVGATMFDEAHERLVDLVAYAPADRHLIHSDLLNFNVLVSDQSISAVIDWGCSLYGDFLYDVAWFAFWSPWYPAWEGIDFPQEAARHYAAIGLDVPHFKERLRCCQVHIGLGSQCYTANIGRWDTLEAVAPRTLAIARGDL